MTEGVKLPGGADRGATRHDRIVRRTAGSWTPAVHHLLTYLFDQGFRGAPRPLRLLTDQIPPEEELTYLEGETVGNRHPWPAWVHSDSALDQTGRWLASYHRVVARYQPPAGAIWRENHAAPGAGVVIAHNDAAPYNAVWNGDALVGFVDWDMAGPRRRDDDLAWTAFSWVPLHAEHVVAAEGFTDFARRRDRLAVFLRAYGPDQSPERILSRLAGLLEAQINLMSARARAGDNSYQHMLDHRRSDDLVAAINQLATI